jgi:hypothetical protein
MEWCYVKDKKKKKNSVDLEQCFISFFEKKIIEMS